MLRYKLRLYLVVLKIKGRLIVCRKHLSKFLLLICETIINNILV